jgi:hypothetical protein
MAGLDPMQYRGAMVDADIAANQGMVGDLNDAELMGMQQYRQMLIDIMNRERYGAEVPNMQAYQADEIANRRSGGLGGFIGDTLGSGLGALTGGLGSGLGNRMSGGGRASPVDYRTIDL